MENQSGREQENLDLTQTEQEIDTVRTPAERSAEKWFLQPWKDKYEELLANFTGSRDNVRDHLERDLYLADADRIEPIQPLKIDQNMQKELKGTIIGQGNNNMAEQSLTDLNTNLTRRKFLAGVGSIIGGVVIAKALENPLSNLKRKEVQSTQTDSGFMNSIESSLQEQRAVLAAKQKEVLEQQSDSQLPESKIGKQQTRIDPFVAARNKSLEVYLRLPGSNKAPSTLEELKRLSNPELTKKLLKLKREKNSKSNK
jgi:hypothetical protein